MSTWDVSCFIFFFSGNWETIALKEPHCYFSFGHLSGVCTWVCVRGKEEERKAEALAVTDVTYWMVVWRTRDFISKVSIPVVREKNFSVLNTKEACLSSGWSEASIRLKQDRRRCLLGRKHLWYKRAHMKWRTCTNALSALLRWTENTTTMGRSHSLLQKCI